MTENNSEMYGAFADWLDNLLENNDMPENTRAFNFNLYEEEDEVYSVQLVACDRFDSDDSDWACYEVWSSEEDIFSVSASDEEDKGWRAFLKFITEIICDYVVNGRYNNILLDSHGIGVGFVDGEVDIIYNKEK